MNKNKLKIGGILLLISVVFAFIIYSDKYVRMLLKMFDVNLLIHSIIGKMYIETKIFKMVWDLNPTLISLGVLALVLGIIGLNMIFREIGKKYKRFNLIVNVFFLVIISFVIFKYYHNFKIINKIHSGTNKEIENIVDSGIDLNIKDYRGHSPLFAAVFKLDFE